MDRSLTGWVHLGASLNHIAHDNGFDFIRTNSGTRDRCTDRRGAEIGRLEPSQLRK